jgi:predicted GNAT superfamily acetyltransferase
MMGVLPAYRATGLGRTLKLAQRDRALATGFDLMEWTFDPLQALNAHLNFARLGVVAEEYAENLYGDSTSALHKGTPTDRFIVQWKLREPHVERRINRDPDAVTMRAADAAGAPTLNPTTQSGKWQVIESLNLDVSERRAWVEIPAAFTEMQQEAPDLALEWRLRTRELFQNCLSSGMRVVDFELDRGERRGRYLLARP